MSAHDLIIIGGGPAGYTAALYAARANLKPLVLEGPQPGGQLTITTEVENYPGFPNGITGPELVIAMKEQAERFGAEFRYETVQYLTQLGDETKLVKTQRELYETKAIILATGASAKWLGIPGEQEYSGKGVSACATCDGFFFRGKNVAVIGGGDTACEEALYLTNMCEKVVLIHRREKLRASQIMQDRVMANPKIHTLLGFKPEEFFGGDGGPEGGGLLKGVLVRSLMGSPIEIRVDGAFVAIGHKPNTDFLNVGVEYTEPETWHTIPGGELRTENEGYIKGTHVALDSNGYICVENTRVMRRVGHGGILYIPGDTIPGVFAAGDCADHEFRQAVTAAGEGCKAALLAERYLAQQAHLVAKEARV